LGAFTGAALFFEQLFLAFRLTLIEPGLCLRQRRTERQQGNGKNRRGTASDNCFFCRASPTNLHL
jgi:hypothetical protein